MSSLLTKNIKLFPLLLLPSHFGWLIHHQAPASNNQTRRTLSISRIKATNKASTDVEMEHVSYEKYIDKTKSSKPIIILHGLLGSKENWNSLAKQLNRRLGRKVSQDNSVVNLY